jgi:thiamine-monophosphate kinase
VAKERRRIDEFEAISCFFAPLTLKEPGAFSLCDDGAVLRSEAFPGQGRSLVVTTDSLISGVHFPSDATPEQIAAKALRVNLSDLAAMGAKPGFYTLSLTLTSGKSFPDEAWFSLFTKRLAAEQDRFSITLVGGDTVVAKAPMGLTISAFGSVETGCELRRSTAQPGDLIYLSGTLGDAALGLKALRGEISGLSSETLDYLLSRYYFPTPRVELGQSLIGIARGVIDISDGLAADIGHVCTASNAGATITIEHIPLSQAARNVINEGENSLFETVLSGGDDYELLFCAPPTAAAELKALSDRLGLSLTPIGQVDEKTGLRIIDKNDRPIDLERPGYCHF